MNQTINNSRNNVKNMPEELQDFNWAAFLLTFVWGLRFKAWITLFAIPLILIQLPFGLNWIILIFFQLYCGINGNKWAYYNEYWKKPKDFRITQMKWAAGALTFYIVVPVFLLSICTKFLKNIDNLPELINNTQCLYANNLVKDDLQRIYLSKLSTNSDLIRQISKKYKYEKLNEYTLQAKTSNLLTSYSVKINKSDNEICSLIEKNCTVEYSFYLENYSKYPTNCIFYFDNSKQIKPEQSTELAIKKGINLFKYL